MSWKLLQGDCREHLHNYGDSTFDACVTDPPYSYNFMGNRWDNLGGGFQAWCSEWGAEILRTLKPGAYALVFGGTRTYHRLAAGIEDAGFEIRDSLHWIYGSGFPKSLDVSKAIDKAAGAEREIIGVSPHAANRSADMGYHGHAENEGLRSITAPATEAAKQWQGWGTALKPAHEPIIVARKPLAKGRTVAANVLEYGTGGINVDGCRVGSSGGGTHCTNRDENGKCLGHNNAGRSTSGETFHAAESDSGRWPPNILLSDEAAEEMDRQSGISTSRKQSKTERKGGRSTNFAMSTSGQTHSDSGGASRFFPVFKYQAKAPKSERPIVDGISHPTVKPLELIRWLARLITLEGGYVLDPFAGSGTTAEACELEGFSSLLIENDPRYIRLIKKRMSRYQTEVAA